MNAKPPLFLQSSLFTHYGIRHGFFTRQGGTSTSPFESLNLSTQVGDDFESVKQNRLLVAKSLGISEQHLHYPLQVHGIQCAIADELTEQTLFEAQAADSVLSQACGVGAAIRTADCVPILLAEKQGPWVAAVHAGWKGCVQNAVAQAIKTLRLQGAQDFIAAIGPHISQAAFEVDEQTAKELLDHSPNPNIVDRSELKPHVDLRSMVRAQLIEAGLQAADIDDVQGCTVSDAELFFSHRRDAKKSGRQVSVIISSAVQS